MIEACYIVALAHSGFVGKQLQPLLCGPVGGAGRRESRLRPSRFGGRGG